MDLIHQLEKLTEPAEQPMAYKLRSLEHNLELTDLSQLIELGAHRANNELKLTYLIELTEINDGGQRYGERRPYDNYSGL